MKFKFLKPNRGFTLVETLVAVSIFVIVVLMGTESVLNASKVSQKGRDLRNIMDNFNFQLELMSRNFREGSLYRCYGDWNPNDAHLDKLETPQSCSSGSAVFFENVDNAPGDPSFGKNQWGYLVVDTAATKSCDVNTVINPKNKYNLCATTDGGDTWIQLNPPEIQFTTKNIFSVLGAEPYTTNKDQQQPLISIKSVAQIAYQNTVTSLAVQTTISQRTLDN